jgi:hypothetical protein
VSRKLSAFEIRVTLANMARMAPDDIDGYVIILAKGAEVTAVMTNSDGEATLLGLLGRTIEDRAAAVGAMEMRERSPRP